MLMITVIIIMTMYHRLIPVFMLSMMLMIPSYQYLGPHGPFIPDGVPDVENCRENWWRNLLLIQNFFRDDQVSKNEITANVKT